MKIKVKMIIIYGYYVCENNKCQLEKLAFVREYVWNVNG